MILRALLDFPGREIKVHLDYYHYWYYHSEAFRYRNRYINMRIIVLIGSRLPNTVLNLAEYRMLDGIITTSLCLLMRARLAVGVAAGSNLSCLEALQKAW